MQIDFESVTSKVQHNGEKGTARENTLKEYLRKYVPEKYCFSKGIIIDCKEEQSRQVDIIIHDKFLTPLLMDMQDTKLVPIESVYAVIEVKSTLTKEELRKCVNNIKSVRGLEKNTVSGYCFPTAGLVFAYDSDTSLETIYKNLNAFSENIEDENKISCICVLNKGIIFPINKNGLNNVSLFPSKNTVYGICNNANDALLLFYLILNQILNSITIFPPNMVAYAQSTELLNTSFTIPNGYVPDDGIINIMENQVKISEIKGIKDYGVRLLSGDVREDEILECVFGAYIPAIRAMHGSIESVPEKSSLDYFGNIISNRKIVEMYKIYNQGAKASEDERKNLCDFKAFMFSTYDKHRPEMHKNKTK